MISRKWIMVESFEEIINLSDNTTDELYIGWKIKAEELINAHSFKNIQSLPYHYKIVFAVSEDLINLLAENLSFVQINELFCRYLSSLNYLKRNNQPYLIIYPACDLQFFIQELTNYITSQGYERIKTIFFEKNSTFVLTTSLIPTVLLDRYSCQITDHVHKNLESSKAERINIFIFLKNSDSLLTISNILGKYDLFLKKNSLVNLFDRLVNLQEEKENINNELLKQEYLNENLKINLDSQKKSGVELLTWYHDQYEILPLWYKRLGHILKVLYGKRTFKSLFIDSR